MVDYIIGNLEFEDVEIWLANINNDAYVDVLDIVPILNSILNTN